MSTRSAWYDRCSSSFSAARNTTRSTVSNRPVACWTLAPISGGGSIEIRAALAIDHLAGHDQVVAGIGRIECTGESGRDQPARAVAGDQARRPHASAAARPMPPTATATILPAYSPSITGTATDWYFQTFFRPLEQVADLHRHGRDDADVGWCRGRRHATFIVLAGVPLAGRALLHRVSGGSAIRRAAT